MSFYSTILKIIPFLFILSSCSNTKITNYNYNQQNDFKTIKINISQNFNKPKLGSQYLLFLPFSKVNSPNINELVYSRAKQYFQLNSLNLLNTKQTNIKLKINNISLNAYDLILLRKNYSKIDFTFILNNQEYRIVESSSFYNPLGFETQLKKSLQLSLDKAFHRMINILRYKNEIQIK